MNRSVSPPVYYRGYYSYLTSVKRPMGPWHRYVFHSLLYCKLIYFSIHLFAPMWLNYIVLLLCFIEPFGLYKSWVSRGSCSHTREGNSVIHEHIQEGVKTALKDGLQDFTLTDAETGTWNRFWTRLSARKCLFLLETIRKQTPYRYPCLC